MPLLLRLVVVLLLYRFVPSRRLKLGDALAGAIVTAAAPPPISLVSGYIFDRTRSLGVHLQLAHPRRSLFLYSVYLAASALLLGAEVAAAWSRLSIGPSEPLTRQIRRVALGLFVHQDPPAARPDRPRVPDRSSLTVERPYASSVSA